MVGALEEQVCGAAACVVVQDAGTNCLAVSCTAHLPDARWSLWRQPAGEAGAPGTSYACSTILYSSCARSVLRPLSRSPPRCVPDAVPCCPLSSAGGAAAA